MQKGMTGRRIGYLLLLAVGFYFAMLYDFQGLRFLICCVVCLPLASLLLLVPKAFLCRVDAGVEQDCVTRGENITVRVTVRNKGLFPVSRIRMVIQWKAPGEKEIRVKKWLCGFGRGCDEVLLELSALHCGQAQVAITKLGVCDYFGIFILPLKKVETVKVYITPIVTSIALEEILYAKTPEGDQEGDIILRNYQPGDSLHRVYWKLAAKTEDLQVRESEREDSITLYLNYSDTFKGQGEKWDQYLDRACSLLCFLMKENRLLKVIWRQDNHYQNYWIDSMESLQGWILALLIEETKKPVLEGQTAYLKEEYFLKEDYFLEGGYHLEEDCKLYFGEQCVYE